MKLWPAIMVLLLSTCDRVSMDIPSKATKYIELWHRDAVSACSKYIIENSWIGLSKDKMTKVLLLHGVPMSKILYISTSKTAGRQGGWFDKGVDEELYLMVSYHETLIVGLKNGIVAKVDRVHPLE